MAQGAVGKLERGLKVKQVLKIAFGIIVGLTVAFIGRLIFASIMIDYAVKEINKTTEHMTNQMQRNIALAIPQSTPIPKAPDPIWIPGRSLTECMGPEKIMDANTMRCTQGYYINETPSMADTERRRISQAQKQDAIAQAKRTCDFWIEQVRKEQNTENLQNQKAACDQLTRLYIGRL